MSVIWRGLDLIVKGHSGYQKSKTRRYMTFPSLPEREREAIRSGLSAKDILAKKSESDRWRRAQERVALDDKTGELSDRLADIILYFCKTVEGVPPAPVLENELVFFLSETRNAAWQMETSDVRQPKLPKRLNLRQRFQRTRPQGENVV